MTQAKMEALRQALQYHYTLLAPALAQERKEPTPEQVIETAKKFEAFLKSK